MLAAEHGSVESLLKLLWGAERLLGSAFQVSGTLLTRLHM